MEFLYVVVWKGENLFTVTLYQKRLGLVPLVVYVSEATGIVAFPDEFDAALAAATADVVESTLF